ncbi:TolC family protein [Cytophagales bacterium LB-30]|uniref:TolC family protein n=1 Tax=Shiella aurantiaca TaxID=3058365 RepID=A0ABT8F9L5_9BACT|nr:TolC family protein [Shiella aurantiaca]MDN4166656.1 TolC family protein [Shiella aurantiaca]
MKNLSLRLAFFLSLMPFLAWSQSEEPQKWTLQQLIDYALEENIQVKLAELDVQTSEVARSQAFWNRVPNLNANANQNYAFGRSIDPFTNQFTNDPVRSNNFSLSSNMTLFAGFQLHNAHMQSMADLEAARYGLQNTRNTVSLNIASFYLTILFNQELLNAAQLRLASTRIQHEQVSKQVRLGALPQANLLQLNQQLATDELEVTRAENTLALSQLNLLQALQMPADTELVLDIPAINEPTINFTLPTVEQVFEVAETTQPQILQAEKNVKGRKLGVSIARGAYFPTLSVSGNMFTQYSSIGTTRTFTPYDTPLLLDQGLPLGASSPSQTGTAIPVFPFEYGQTQVSSISFADQIDLNRRENLSFTLSIPIFTRFQSRNNVSNAKINLERAELNQKNVKNQLRQTVEQAYYDVVAAAKTFDAVQKQVIALEESNRNIEQRFQLGAANVVEYNQTRNDFNRAQSDLIRAKYDYIFKLKILDFYQGKPLEL